MKEKITGTAKFVFSQTAKLGQVWSLGRHLVLSCTGYGARIAGTISEKHQESVPLSSNHYYKNWINLQ